MQDIMSCKKLVQEMHFLQLLAEDRLANNARKAELRVVKVVNY